MLTILEKTIQKLNEIDTQIDTDSTLQQRRLLVIGSSLMILWFWIEGFIFLWFRTSGLTGYGANILVTVAAIISFTCQYRLYRLNTAYVASAPDKEIDERQKAVRDHAYRRAYHINIWIVLITLSLMIVSVVYLNAIPAGLLLPTIGLLWCMALLPTWVVAWTERGN